MLFLRSRWHHSTHRAVLIWVFTFCPLCEQCSQRACEVRAASGTGLEARVLRCLASRGAEPARYICGLRNLTLGNVASFKFQLLLYSRMS
ncbi:hypothetical protein C8Q70DRAFT_947501 [Cubamyces menziesii]|nr:hypothetical protein C8Q70DRAFT_947501 [Cubamyces menziesii]